MAAGGATGGVLVWDRSSFESGGGCEEGAGSDSGKRAGGPRPTADLRNNGHEYGVSVSHLAAYPDGSFFVSADSTKVKVISSLIHGSIHQQRTNKRYKVRSSYTESKQRFDPDTRRVPPFFLHRWWSLEC